MKKPLFITFEGGEGSGKSTQIQLLSEYLKKQNCPFITTREPGGSKGAEEIRTLLLKGGTDRWDKITEILLFSAARRDHLKKVIWPALEKGISVICDRFADSTMAYQGYGYGEDEATRQMLHSIYHLIAGDFKPDITLILDINPQTGIKRSCARAGNTEQRFESMDLSFHQNIRDGFLKIAANQADRCVIIDAERTPEAVHADIVRHIVEKWHDFS